MDWLDDLNAVEIRRHRRVWRPWLEKYNIENICEVGVFASQNFKRLLEGNPKVIVGVDSWLNDGNLYRNDSDYSQEVLDQQCEYFKSLMPRFPAMRLYRMYSHEAVKNFPDEYFDLIYIDGDHSYEGVRQDLNNWWSKVKKGKYFTGDDYSVQRSSNTNLDFHVIEAVDEFAAKVGLPVHKLTRNGWAIIKPE